MKTEQINPAVRADKVTHRRTFTDSGNNKLLFLRHVRSNPCLWSADQQDELRNRQAAWSNLLGFFCCLYTILRQDVKIQGGTLQKVCERNSSLVSKHLIYLI